jgi:DNA-binding transcriptional LysR family regulator
VNVGPDPSRPHVGQRIKQLLLVLDLAEHKQIGAAAAACGLSRGATSRMLLALEREIGAELFVRRRAGLTPTRAGRIVIRRAHAAIGQLARMEADVRAIEEGRAGAIRLGIVTWLASGRVANAVCALKRAYPFLSVDIVVGTHAALANRLARRELDIVLAGPDLPLAAARGGHYEPIGKQRFAIFARRGHPLLGPGGDVALDVAQVEWVWGLPSGPDVAPLVAVLDRHCGRGAEQVLKAGDLATALMFIVNGDRLGILPVGAADALLEQGHLVELRAGFRLPELDYGILIGGGIPRHVPLLALVDLLRRTA